MNTFWPFRAGRLVPLPDEEGLLLVRWLNARRLIAVIYVNGSRPLFRLFPTAIGVLRWLVKARSNAIPDLVAGLEHADPLIRIGCLEASCPYLSRSSGTVSVARIRHINRRAQSLARDASACRTEAPQESSKVWPALRAFYCPFVFLILGIREQSR
jgi:hypothetical protein